MGLVRLIAHRGFAAIHPENTLRAVRRASEVADVVEIDVRRCGSGEIVVIHDETVDRVTNASGPVKEFTRSELASLSVFGSGEGVPTLAEVVEAVPPDVGLNVELKEAGLASDVLDVLDDAANEAFVSSFCDGALREGREAGTVPLAYLYAEPGGIERALESGCDFIHPHHDLVDESSVERAHEAGLEVNAWTIRERETAGRLTECGVDGVIADDPSVLG